MGDTAADLGAGGALEGTADTPGTPAADDAVSIADHAARFSPEALEAAAVDGATDADVDNGAPATPHHSAQQRRDRERGTFAEGRKRARSQNAGADDVETIGELTRRIKAAEEADGADIVRKENESERVYQLRRRAELLERRTAAGKAPEPAALTGTTATPSQRVAVAPPAATPGPGAPGADAKPDYNDVRKYPDGRYDAQFIEDLSSWGARAEWNKLQAKAAEKETIQQAERRWNDGVQAARAKYPDFDAVALKPSAIPQGSIPDVWILEHKQGPLVLYHLQSHPQELDAILRMDRLGQIEELASLSRRFASPSPVLAGTTGAAAGGSPVKPLPKPPTPVRAEAQRANDLPKNSEAGSIAEHRRQFGPQSRI